MKGFDKKFINFPDYILGITNEIWENRGVDSLNHYYSEDIIVRSPENIVIGNKSVIDATYATLLEFPDRELLGEDVIWSGSPEEGMLSSHRILSTATHLGEGSFGKPSGKKLVYRVIADCHAINNQINDEWLIRDQGAIVRQLGWNPKDYALMKIEKENELNKKTIPFNSDIDLLGPYTGKGNNNEWGLKYKEILNSIMNSQFSIVEKEYDRAIQTEYSGGITGHSYKSVENFWKNLRTCFPNSKFEIHHLIGRDDKNMSPRAAIRWSLNGYHEGDGIFGKPTKAKVYVMGVSHVEFGPWGIRKEYSLYDETIVWKQILLSKKV
tara:strand:+ start:648 stop:1619 length:972 start_codon:yes stop_codon:yes gene_type:complete